MYEASFDLKRRPFGATPDATCFLAAAPIQAALDEIMVCIEQGQGISVLTAPAGVGKTLLCERLRSELGPRFETVFLRHASFLTRRALLQTLLCELNHSYQHPSEQELRLALWPAIRELQPEREALVLICDEAHQLSKSLIEELRILADFAEAGKPLVRLVLVGQLNLEEKLTLPSLEAFNQRIRAHVNLPTFDRAGSLDYIDYRLTWAGGRTDEIFTPQALDMIVQASDGVPRCINQLADHTLLLAFVAEQRPVREELVREALNDLRQLPLHWNEPTGSRVSVDTWQPTVEGSVTTDFSVENDFQAEQQLNGSHQSAYVYESPAANTGTELPQWENYSLESEPDQTIDHDHLDSWEAALSTDSARIEPQSDDWKHVVDLFRVSAEASSQSLSDTVDTESHVEPAAPALREFPKRVVENRLPLPISAEESETLTVTGDSSVPTGNLESPTRVESPRSAPSSPAKNEIGVNRPNSIQTMTNTFEEEVIFDRYAAIDAGFVPTFMSHDDKIIQDTAVPAEVHAARNVAAEIVVELVQETHRADQPTAAAPVLVSAESSSISTEEADDSEFNSDSHGLEQILGAVQELIELTSSGGADFDPATSREDESAAATSSAEPVHGEDFATEDLFDWNRHDDRIERPSFVEPDFMMTEEIERTHDSYSAAIKSEWPSFGVPQNEEEILRSLQREVLAGSASIDPAADYVRSETVSQPVWESVETEPVEATEKPRPFRYLFSMLRRKQQQSN